MDQLLGWAHIIGIFVAWLVFYRRAGLADIKAHHGIDWREFFIPNLPYFLVTWGKMLVWEFVLVVWLVTGRRPSPWKAAAEIDGRPVRRVARVGSSV